MVWDIKKNKKDISDICVVYSINYMLNKSILEHISIQELQSKIEFLRAYNIPYLDKFGKLIDIFSMSSKDMQDKYNISLEEIINKYYIKNKRKMVYYKKNPNRI